MTALIIIGASFLLSCMLLIPAEKQIYRSRMLSSESEPEHLSARKDYHWTSRGLDHLLTFGFTLLVMYILLDNPKIVDSILMALSLK